MTVNIKPTKPGRPKSFDDRIVSYMPGLYSLSGKLGFRDDEKDEIVNETVVVALHRWGSFREDGGFWNWLALTMRACAQEKRNKARRRIVTVADESFADRLRQAPEQLDYLELSETLGRISGRNGDILLRRAMGDGLAEISADVGLSRERVRQIEESERAALREAA